MTFPMSIVLLIFVHFFVGHLRSLADATAVVPNDLCGAHNNKTVVGQQTIVRLPDGRCCYRTPTKYVCSQGHRPVGTVFSGGTSPLTSAASAHPFPVDNNDTSPASHCASLPEDVRHGCKMVAQIWAEARKAEAEGTIVSPDDLPPPSSGLGLRRFDRIATRAELDAQPPPTVIAERYACLNITCLCTFFGGVPSSVSAGQQQCMLSSSSTNASSTRARRQSGTPNLSMGRALRMEYRMLSDNQRQRFHAALQQLKRGFGSYEYDRLSFLHSSTTMMPSAHGGPTFLLWHREFVKRMEIALRAIDPSVAVPYWDSSMDGRLSNPADSIMWSNLFMGSPSASGAVADGPLASWITPSGGPIRRRLGAGGALFTEQQVASLIRTPQLANILAFTGQRCPAPNPSNVLEFVHNNVHMWVGGDMGPLITSPQDPVFFLHHSFVDYIFEQWRQLNQNRQQRETQFPDDAQILSCAGSPNYRLSATMLPFQDPVVLNGAALSNSYTDSLYSYAPRPTCRAPGGCSSPYLFCDTISGGGVPLCTAKIRAGGDCARFASNADQPCFASACVNGRCQAGAASQASAQLAPPPLQRNVRSIAAYNVQHQRDVTGAKTTTWSPYVATPMPLPSTEQQRICLDKHECCAHWAARSACRTAPRHMNTWCPGSCRFDGCRPPPAELQSTGECHDIHSQCDRWARFNTTSREHVGLGLRTCFVPGKVLLVTNAETTNECVRNPHWMAQNCAKTCGKCADAAAHCRDIPKDHVLPMIA